MRRFRSLLTGGGANRRRATRRLLRLKRRRFARSTTRAICLRRFVYQNANWDRGLGVGEGGAGQMGCTHWSASRWSRMSNTKLQDFVTQTAARSQITFGDVRRLRRDCLPGGINAGEEVGILIWLESAVSRADKAWAQWLVAAVADFALRSEVTEDGIVDWLKRLTATTAQGTTVRPPVLWEIGR